MPLKHCERKHKIKYVNIRLVFEWISTIDTISLTHLGFCKERKTNQFIKIIFCRKQFVEMESSEWKLKGNQNHDRSNHQKSFDFRV